MPKGTDLLESIYSLDAPPLAPTSARALSLRVQESLAVRLWAHLFITHGSLDRWLKVRLASSTEREAAESDAHLVWDRYTTLCETVLKFMNAALKDDPTALNDQLAHDREQVFRGDQPRIEAVPPGADGPEPYSASRSSTPSPRQVRQLLRTNGVDAAVRPLREGWRPEPCAHKRRWQYPA